MIAMTRPRPPPPTASPPLRPPRRPEPRTSVTCDESSWAFGSNVIVGQTSGHWGTAGVVADDGPSAARRPAGAPSQPGCDLFAAGDLALSRPLRRHVPIRVFAPTLRRDS